MIEDEIQDKALENFSHILETVSSHDQDLLDSIGLQSAKFLQGARIEVVDYKWTEEESEKIISIKCRDGKTYFLALVEI